MASLEVARSVEIERDADIVRRQFGDVAHHEATGVHRAASCSRSLQTTG